MGKHFKLLRLDCGPFRPSELERRLIAEAGVDELVEIEGYDPDMILDIQPDAIAIISGYLRKDTIQKLTHCRAILRLGIGTDKIDVAAATEKGIMVTNLPDFCEHEMAEHAIALMLAAARRLTQMERSLYDGTFLEAKRSVALHRVYGTTLGLIGFGKSARNVALIAHAMGMRIIDYHRHVQPEIEAQYHVTPVSLDDLLIQSDYIMLLCPLTQETRSMIGARELRLMKRTAVLINTARGAICDERSLAQALKEKTIAYAGIDVFEHFDIFKKPAGPPDCLYFGLDNVLLTPHIGGSSCEAGNDGYQMMGEQLKSIVLNQKPIHCINF
jgi:D-3-phosphoglycerate dehydrogenase / 2-oxoglutarate reductase